MAFPTELGTRQVSFGQARVMESGAPLGMRVSVKASRNLLHRPSGQPLIAIETTYTSDGSTDGTLELPVCDSPDMGLGNGTSIDVSDGKVTHTYTAKIQYLDPVSMRELPGMSKTVGPFAVPTGTGTIDLDDLLIGPTLPTLGLPVQLPDTWTASITAAESAAAAAEAVAVGLEPRVTALEASGGGSGGGGLPDGWSAGTRPSNLQYEGIENGKELSVTVGSTGLKSIANDPNDWTFQQRLSLSPVSWGSSMNQTISDEETGQVYGKSSSSLEFSPSEISTRQQMRDPDDNTVMLSSLRLNTDGVSVEMQGGGMSKNTNLRWPEVQYDETIATQEYVTQKIAEIDPGGGGGTPPEPVDPLPAGWRFEDYELKNTAPVPGYDIQASMGANGYTARVDTLDGNLTQRVYVIPTGMNVEYTSKGSTHKNSKVASVNGDGISIHSSTTEIATSAVYQQASFYASSNYINVTTKVPEMPAKTLYLQYPMPESGTSYQTIATQQWTAQQTANFAPLKNAESLLSDATNDHVGTYVVEDDGSPSSGWRDRLVFMFRNAAGVAKKVFYLNEYFEVRIAARPSTVPFRVFGKEYNSDPAHSPEIPLLEVQNDRDNRVSEWSVKSGGRTAQTGDAVIGGKVTAANLPPAFLTLNAGDPVPPGTPAGTWIARRP